MSLHTPATDDRMKARRSPSGEYIGLRSIHPAGGEVIFRMLESEVFNAEIHTWVGSASLLSVNAIDRPSGDHVSPPPRWSGPRYKRRSAPPSASMEKMESDFPSYRVNAISRPSGDQVGQQSP